MIALLSKESTSEESFAHTIAIVEQIGDVLEQLPEHVIRAHDFVGGKTVQQKLYAHLLLAARKEGLRRISLRADQIDHDAFVAALFSGLYLVGRSGSKLDSTSLTSTTHLIQAICTQEQNQQSQLLLDWCNESPEFDLPLHLRLAVH